MEKLKLKQHEFNLSSYFIYSSGSICWELYRNRICVLFEIGCCMLNWFYLEKNTQNVGLLCRWV